MGCLAVSDDGDDGDGDGDGTEPLAIDLVSISRHYNEHAQDAGVPTYILVLRH